MLETLLAGCLVLSKAQIQDKIEYYSQEMGAYTSMVDFIIRNESGYNNCIVGDAHITGKDTPSLGLSQINLKFNPSVTPEQALDPDFAIKYLINDLRAGKLAKWTTGRMFKAKYPNHPYFSITPSDSL